MSARLLTFLLGLALLAAAAPAGAVEPDNRCLRYAERYIQREQTRDGLIFHKNDQTGAVYYGCLFSQERARRLPTPGASGGLRIFEIALDGRYVAYDVDTATAPDRVIVFDIRQNAAKVNEPAGSGPEAIVEGLVVKKNGTVGWIGGGDAGLWEVWRYTDTKTLLESGSDIVRNSIGKSRDDRAIYWQNGLEARTAPFP